jgi:hypothetical protein
MSRPTRITTGSAAGNDAGGERVWTAVPTADMSEEDETGSEYLPEIALGLLEEEEEDEYGMLFVPSLCE